MFNSSPQDKTPSPIPLTMQLYYGTPRIQLLGWVTEAVMLKFFKDGSAVLHAKRLIIEINSPGCDAHLISIVKNFLRMLCAQTDVRIVARRTCASSTLYFMNSVPAECRYGTPNIDIWVDAGFIPDEIMSNLSPEERSMMIPLLDQLQTVRKLTLSVDHAMEIGVFSQIIHWL